jgi:dTMP kinase
MSLASRFITLEGIDGAGKSTHVQWLADELARRGAQVVVTREPGGTPIGERLRELLLDHRSEVSADTETLLMFAARREHLERVIWPALHGGKTVLCDRFTDATFAYQGGGRQIPLLRLAALEQWVHPDFQPDLTLLFDVPVSVSRQRLAKNESLDRFEQERAAFFERVRQAYLDRANADSPRFRIIDGAQTLERVRVQLSVILDTL